MATNRLMKHGLFPKQTRLSYVQLERRTSSGSGRYGIQRSMTDPTSSEMAAPVLLMGLLLLGSRHHESDFVLGPLWLPDSKT